MAGMPDLPLTTRFELGSEITAEQRDFLDVHGFLVFASVASRGEVDEIVRELERIEAEWAAEGRQWVNGIPVFWGRWRGRPLVQRFTFTSLFSEPIRRFVRDERFEPIRLLIGEDARVGDDEKDGVVVNRFGNHAGSVHERVTLG